ncbi:M16 family metallopeptidase [Spirosoma pollinicola]|uniref:Insulinase family protein n=1 Tax=Spirosoma pollinicola TaxID=2057025 RepID=A0A2K8YWG6_9BACT|nr:pitrilysin family protein [Spirosoma pollinicola]AUD01977.1 insulinase family protein [Spirosoma pollinicola]
MKRILLLLTGLTLLAGSVMAQKQTPPEGGKPKDFILPKRQVITLENGLKASMVPYGTVPKVTITMIVRTGNMHEKANESWLSDLLAQLMQEGTTSRTAQALSEEVARMGGSLSISSNFSAMMVSGSVLSEYAPALVSLLADVLMNPRFPASEVDRLKADLKRQLTVQKDRPQSQANEKFAAAMYPDQPYGRIYPTVEMIANYDLAKIRGFYDAQFGAQRTQVYVAGKFDEGAVEKAIRTSLSSWRKGPALEIPIAKPSTNKGFALIDRPSAPQSTLIVGLPILDPSQPDYVSMVVANSLLGGSFGSRITSNIRENKGYTYSPYSSINSYYRGGTWTERADVTTANTGASLNEIMKEVNLLRSTAPSKAELTGIQNYESGIFVLRNSSPMGIINQLSFVDFHGLDESYLTNYVKNVMAITPDQVQQVTQKYINPQNMTVIVVGDRSKVEGQLTDYKPAGKLSGSK